jgi:predicted Zn-ribbon and HTH transcriptional regulator
MTTYNYVCPDCGYYDAYGNADDTPTCPDCGSDMCPEAECWLASVLRDA